MKLKLGLRRQQGAPVDLVITADATATVGDVARGDRRTTIPLSSAARAAPHAALTLAVAPPTSSEPVVLDPQLLIGDAAHRLGLQRGRRRPRARGAVGGDGAAAATDARAQRARRRPRVPAAPRRQRHRARRRERRRARRPARLEASRAARGRPGLVELVDLNSANGAARRRRAACSASASITGQFVTRRHRLSFSIVAGTDAAPGRDRHRTRRRTACSTASHASRCATRAPSTRSGRADRGDRRMFPWPIMVAPVLHGLALVRDQRESARRC